MDQDLENRISALESTMELVVDEVFDKRELPVRINNNIIYKYCQDQKDLNGCLNKSGYQKVGPTFVDEMENDLARHYFDIRFLSKLLGKAPLSELKKTNKRIYADLLKRVKTDDFNGYTQYIEPSKRLDGLSYLVKKDKLKLLSGYGNKDGDATNDPF